MKGFALAAVLPSIVVGGGTVQLPRLGQAVAIDVNVQSVTWHPKGIGLLYTKTEGAGSALGAFAVGQREGRVLLHLEANDRWEAEWFAAQAKAVVIVYRVIQSAKPQTSATVYIIDAKDLTAKEVFSRTAPVAARLDLDVDTSPSLIHAIFRVKESGGKTHFILPTGGGKLVSARDLDRAESEGLAGPTWSVDGTAIYAKSDGTTALIRALESGTSKDSIELALTAEKATSRQGELNLVVTKDLALDTMRLKLDLSNFVISPPVPNVGATVWEVMPSNGFLRSVRFRGAWQWRKEGSPDLVTQRQRSLLEFGVSKGQSNSLWLTQPKDQVDLGTLIAAEASMSWLSPPKNAIAYLTDGALFVRTLEAK